MTEFTIIKPNGQTQVDVAKIHKLLTAAGYHVTGVCWDEETAELRIIVADDETKDPSNDPIITSYVYVAPKVYDWPALYQEAKAKYVTAQAAYKAAADAYQAGPTQAKLAAAVQAQNEVSKTLAEILVMFAKSRALEQLDE